MSDNVNKEWKKRADEYAFYAIQRMDLLLISVSFGGLYAAWEIFKFIQDKLHCVNYTLLLFACILFLVCIISNFLSQWCSFYAHWHEENDKKSKQYAKFIQPMNFTSLISLILGLILLGIFAFIHLSRIG